MQVLNERLTGWTMRGYSKVDDNTFPNIMANVERVQGRGVLNVRDMTLKYVDIDINRVDNSEQCKLQQCILVLHCPAIVHRCSDSVDMPVSTQSTAGDCTRQRAAGGHPA